jgi:hypothetical protein
VAAARRHCARAGLSPGHRRCAAADSSRSSSQRPTIAQGRSPPTSREFQPTCPDTVPGRMPGNEPSHLGCDRLRLRPAATGADRLRLGVTGCHRGQPTATGYATGVAPHERGLRKSVPSEVTSPAPARTRQRSWVTGRASQPGPPTAPGPARIEPPRISPPDPPRPPRGWLCWALTIMLQPGASLFHQD